METFFVFFRCLFLFSTTSFLVVCFAFHVLLLVFFFIIFHFFFFVSFYFSFLRLEPWAGQLPQRLRADTMLILSNAKKVHVCGMCKCTQRLCGVYTSRRLQGIVIACKRNLCNFLTLKLATTHLLMSAMLKRNLMRW